jgi:hypothetical protein
VNGTVTLEQAFEISRLTPTSRLEQLTRDSYFASAHATLRELLAAYEHFLKETDATEAVLLGRLRSKAKRERMLQAQDKFGELMFRALEEVGAKTPFYRMLVV